MAAKNDRSSSFTASNTMIGKYAFSLNGEHFQNSFETREEAVTAGIEAARRAADSPQTVYVGRRVPADPKVSGHARAVLSNMAARAREEFGDAASAYLANLSKPQIEQLDDNLELTILAWLESNNLLPTFFKIDSIGEYSVPTSGQHRNGESIAEVQEIGSGDYGM